MRGWARERGGAGARAKGGAGAKQQKHLHL